MAIPNWLINLGGKLSGAGKVFTWLDGKKAKIGAAALALNGLAGIINKLVAVTDLASLIELAKSLPASPEVGNISLALAAWGIRHAVAKSTTPQ